MLHGPKRDLFRLRKQNTSRPPSMQVDDFMAAKVTRQTGLTCCLSACLPYKSRNLIFFPLPSFQSGSKSGRGMSHDHGLSSRLPGGGRGGSHFPYMPQPGMFMPASMQGGGRWLGSGGGLPPAGMGYPRRDVVGGAMRTPSSWDARIPSAFLSASQLKSSALRCALFGSRCALF